MRGLGLEEDNARNFAHGLCRGLHYDLRSAPRPTKMKNFHPNLYSLSPKVSVPQSKGPSGKYNDIGFREVLIEHACIGVLSVWNSAIVRQLFCHACFVVLIRP